MFLGHQGRQLAKMINKWWKVELTNWEGKEPSITVHTSSILFCCFKSHNLHRFKASTFPLMLWGFIFILFNCRLHKQPNLEKKPHQTQLVDQWAQLSHLAGQTQECIIYAPKQRGKRKWMKNKTTRSKRMSADISLAKDTHSFRHRFMQTHGQT